LILRLELPYLLAKPSPSGYRRGSSPFPVKDGCSILCCGRGGIGILVKSLVIVLDHGRNEFYNGSCKITKIRLKQLVQSGIKPQSKVS